MHTTIIGGICCRTHDQIPHPVWHERIICDNVRQRGIRRRKRMGTAMYQSTVDLLERVSPWHRGMFVVTHVPRIHKTATITVMPAVVQTVYVCMCFSHRGAKMSRRVPAKAKFEEKPKMASPERLSSTGSAMAGMFIVLACRIAVLSPVCLCASEQNEYCICGGKRS